MFKKKKKKKKRLKRTREDTPLCSDLFLTIAKIDR